MHPPWLLSHGAEWPRRGQGWRRWNGTTRLVSDSQRHVLAYPSLSGTHVPLASCGGSVVATRSPEIARSRPSVPFQPDGNQLRWLHHPLLLLVPHGLVVKPRSCSGHSLPNSGSTQHGLRRLASRDYKVPLPIAAPLNNANPF